MTTLGSVQIEFFRFVDKQRSRIFLGKNCSSILSIKANDRSLDRRKVVKSCDISTLPFRTRKIIGKECELMKGYSRPITMECLVDVKLMDCVGMPCFLHFSGVNIAIKIKPAVMAAINVNRIICCLLSRSDKSSKPSQLPTTFSFF